MARRTVFDESSDDEFPEIHALGRKDASQPQVATLLEEEPCKSTVRRRKLAQITDNPLLRPWNEDKRSATADNPAPQDSKHSKSRVQTRKRAQRPPVIEVEVDEQLSDGDDFVDDSSEDDSSEFHTALGSEDDDDDDDDDNDYGLFSQASTRPPIKPLPPRKSNLISSTPMKPEKRLTGSKGAAKETPTEHSQKLCTPPKAGRGAAGGLKGGQRGDATKGTTKSIPQEPYESSLTQAFSKLQTEDNEFRDSDQSSTKNRPVTPTATPPKARAGGLTSPKKLARIPMTPHRPSMDTFWSQEFVDEWNDEHSPKKTLWLPQVNRSPSKKSPSKKADIGKAAKKAFSNAKHDLADSFLRELDVTITGGRLQELAESTGGIKINWTNKLNTTAGRANWKRETIKTRQPSRDEVVTTHRHHASIELAEKVIDDEHRLLNVIAHEFCHLANFMISGVTGNPHGREFKSWAAKCSRSFGDRGIEVTTKHTYDIDFKYTWECTICSMEFKRHSKSIHPERHRCGSCKGELKQTKPVPRASGKVSEYQKFMREQMKLVKEENPRSPQKEIMRLVADKWSRKDAVSSETMRHDTNVNDVAEVLVQLTLEDKKG